MLFSDSLINGYRFIIQKTKAVSCWMVPRTGRWCLAPLTWCWGPGPRTRVKPGSTWSDRSTEPVKQAESGVYFNLDAVG